MSYIYGEPPHQFGQMIAIVSMKSHRQARLMATIMAKACADYAGKPEETLIAKWHNEAVKNMRKSEDEGWIGWQDTYPVEPKRGSE